MILLETIQKYIIKYENKLKFNSKDIKKNDIITKEVIRSVRPGYGLHPKYLFDIIGKKATSNFKKGDRVTKSSFI